MNRNVAPPRTNFSATEDAILVDIVSKMTEIDWKTVADLLGTRNARQCRERYHNYLAPEVSVKEWTPDDDRLLVEQYEVFGPQWAKMRSSFPGRSCVNIKNRWAKISARRKRERDSSISGDVKTNETHLGAGARFDNSDIDRIFASLPSDEIFLAYECDGLDFFAK